MTVHRMPPQDEPFDPRRAALSHAGMAEQLGQLVGHDGPSDPMRLVGELASALACGLVYVGDRIAAAVERPSALQVVLPTPEAVATWRGLEPETPPQARFARLMKALERIRDHEEQPGSGPPDDEMREIAREALRIGYPTSDELPPAGLRVAPPQSPLIGARVVGWDSGGGGGVLVRMLSTGATYRIAVGTPLEIPAKVELGEIAPAASKEVRAVTPCTLELDGERHDLAAGDSLEVPGLTIRMVN